MTSRWVETARRSAEVEHIRDFLSKDDLIRLYRGADAFVAPFRGEGFGMKILDAAAVGLPVIVPAYGGPLDYLRSGDFTSVDFAEVPVGQCLDRAETIIPAVATWAEVSVADLALKMQSVMSNPAESRAAAARSRAYVLEQFSWDAAAKRLIDTLGRWGEDREANRKRNFAAAASRRLSVVMPTHNRPDILGETLEAYAAQTLPRDQWELVLVDDASRNDVGALADAAKPRIELQYQRNETRQGPGPTRNTAIAMAKGKYLLFTGDDIVPEPDFLERHLAAHAKLGDTYDAVVGQTVWHRALPVSDFMKYVTGEGGQQFNYNAILHNQTAHYGYFYTSNVSISRKLLMTQETAFSDRFKGYGYEDTELGLRLAQAGMNLFYDSGAVGAHFHPMTDEQIIRRQYRVGRMLAYFASMHPGEMPQEHEDLLRSLDTLQHTIKWDELSDSSGARGSGRGNQTVCVVERAQPGLGLDALGAAALCAGLCHAMARTRLPGQVPTVAPPATAAPSILQCRTALRTSGSTLKRATPIRRETSSGCNTQVPS